MTKNQIIEDLVKQFNESTGHDPVIWRRIDKRNVASVGSYTVDNSYGGYRLEQIFNESGGITTPFGHDRYTGPKFIQFLRTILAARGIQ